MAEKITRTIKATNFTVECINPETHEFTEIDFHLTGVVDTEKQFQKLQKTFTRPDRILLRILHKETIEELREMDLDFFIQNSTPVEPKETITYRKK